MATGDLTVFQAFSETLGQEIHDFDNDTLKLGIVTGVTPVRTLAESSVVYLQCERD